MLFETDGGALVDVEVFVNCGFGYQVRCEAVCEAGSARIGDDQGMLVTTGGTAAAEVPQDYLVRFVEAYDREVQAWVDATRRGLVTGPTAWDGYAASAVAEAGIRALDSDTRVAVELAPRPGLYTAAWSLTPGGSQALPSRASSPWSTAAPTSSRPAATTA